jgi:hypothetical protein
MNDKIIELIKWLISSVCIVVVTLIIDTGFKEREAGIKEMEVYDKYVDIILQADNIEQRWKLCEYFSIVTPTERLRQRWIAYKDTISKDYYTWKKSQYQDSTITIEMNNSPLVGGTIQNNSQARLSELNGFNSILDKDYQKSITYFELAEENYPGFHNCYEILKYLKSKPELEDQSSKSWNIFYNKLLEEWSWKMPESIKQSLKTTKDI